MRASFSPVQISTRFPNCTGFLQLRRADQPTAPLQQTVNPTVTRTEHLRAGPTSNFPLRLHSTCGARLTSSQRARYSRDTRYERTGWAGRAAFTNLLSRPSHLSAGRNASVDAASRGGELGLISFYLANLGRSRLGSVRYFLREPEANDWSASLRARLEHVVGSDEWGQKALDLLAGSLSAGTLNNYATGLRLFAQFCHDHEDIAVLEATTATVIRYTAWIGERGTISAKSLQPYYSSINSFFTLHGLDPIAKDSVHLTAARKGLSLLQGKLDDEPIRVPLPADVALQFVVQAERMLLLPLPFDPQFRESFRALLACIINFLFFNRGLTGVSCRVQDLFVDTDSITLRVYQEKGRVARQRGAESYRVLRVPILHHGRIAAILRYFIDNIQSRTARPDTKFWAISPAEHTAKWESGTMTKWLNLATNLVQARPGEESKWTSHSLRKGPASAANAIGMPMTHIKFMGGWAKNSDVVNDYCDPMITPSRGAWFFFGYLTPQFYFQQQQHSASAQPAAVLPIPPTPPSAPSPSAPSSTAS